LNVFGNDSLIIKNFKRQYLYEQTIINDFFVTIDRKNLLINLNNVVDQNVSLSANSISFLYYFNKKYPVFKNGNVNSERGLVLKRNYWVKVLKNIDADIVKNEIILSDVLKRDLNKEIEKINPLISNKGIDFLSLDGSLKNEFYINKNIPMDYYLELINELFKEIDKLMRA